MSGFSISVNDHALKAAITALQKNLADFSPLWPTFGEIIRTSVADTFMAEGRPQRWPPMSAAARRRRGGNARQRAGAKLLQHTGRLLHSITVAGAPGSITEGSPMELAIGTNLEYAAIHNFGGIIDQPARSELVRRKRGSKGRFVRGTEQVTGSGRQGRFTFAARSITMPARPFAVLQSADLDEMEATMGEWLLRNVGQDT